MSEIERESPQRLARLRSDLDAWPEVACADTTNDEGYWTDAHAATRYGVLLALQYDLRPKDQDLVRFLFQQEALRHRREPFEGLFPALQLAGFLLANYGQVEHVWDFAQAKLANFDTYCGFDLQYLVSAGIGETLAFVRANQNPLRDDVLKWLTQGTMCGIQEQDLKTWWSKQRKVFPSERANESPEVRLDQALELGELDDAHRWLRVFESAAPPTLSSLHTLASYWADLQDWDQAALLTQELLALPELGSYWRVSAMVRLAKYQRLSKRPHEAWHTLVEARPQLDAGDWRRAGSVAKPSRRSCFWPRCSPPSNPSPQERRMRGQSITWSTPPGLRCICWRLPSRLQRLWATKLRASGMLKW